MSKIPLLPAADELTGEEELPLVQTGATKKSTVGKLLHDRIGRLQVVHDLQPPTAGKNVRISFPEKHRMLVAIYPQDNAYRDGYARSGGDHILLEFIDLNNRWPTNTVPDQKAFWTPNCYATVMAGIKVEFINLVWNQLLGSQTENGLLPSTIPFAQFLGRTSTSIGIINAGGGAGPYHGDVIAFGINMILTNGIKNGVALAASFDIRDSYQAGDVYYADAFNLVTDIQLWDPEYDLEDPENQPVVVGTAQENYLFQPSSGYQIRYLPNITYAADPAVHVTFGYIFMWPFTGANKIQGFALSGGAAGATQNIALGSGSVSLTGVNKIRAWNTNTPSHAVEIMNNGAYAPFRRNGVAPALAGLDPFVVMNSNISKLYFPTHGNSLDADIETGNVLTGWFSIDGVRANES